MLEIKSMKDIERQKEIAQHFIDMYDSEIEYAKKVYKQIGPQEVTGIDYSSPRVQNGNIQLDYGEYLIQVRQAENNKYLHEERLKYLKQKEKQIRDRLEELDGLDYKVVYMRDIENMSLQEIADKLYLSYGYVKNISYQNKLYD